MISLGESEYTMDVHIGKCHSEKFECGICDCKTKTIEDLDMHLFSCELYKCASNDDLECECKVKLEITLKLTTNMDILTI